MNNSAPNPMPTLADLEALKERVRDSQAVSGCLMLLSEMSDPWAHVLVTPALNDCTLRLDEVNRELSILVIQCGQERAILHRMANPDPKIVQSDFGVLAQSRMLRTKGLESIIEHWYTFVGAEELLRQAAARVPDEVMGARDVFNTHFPLLYDAATSGGF